MKKILVKAIHILAILHLVCSNAPPVFDKDWSSVLSQPENAPIGTTIKVFSVSDPDGDNMYLSAVGADTQEFFTITPSEGRGIFNASIVISKALDCDPPRQSLTSIGIRVTDRDNGEGNTVDVKSHFVIIDVNDEIPKFTSGQFSWTVDENVWPSEDVLFAATDNDQSLSFYSMKLSLNPNTQSSTVANEYNNTFQIITTTQTNRTAFARVRLLKPLDFETNMFYSFKINATDNSGNGNSETHDVIIRVQDVQDNSPVFTSSLYRQAIKEDVYPGYSVLVVSAIDGDFGTPRKINYKILQGPCSSLFQIDSGGLISTKTTLDIVELPETRICQLTIQAYEVISGMNSGLGDTSSTTDVWITILDVSGENPANCNSNANVLSVKYRPIRLLWFATLVANVGGLLN